MATSEVEEWAFVICLVGWRIKIGWQHNRRVEVRQAA